MKSLYFLFILSALLLSCNNSEKKKPNSDDSAKLTSILANYYEERLRLFPLEATAIADNRYNDLLPCDISEFFREKERTFFKKYLDSVSLLDRSNLKGEDVLSYDVFKREMGMQLEALGFQDHLMPVNQFWGLPLTFAQLGSGGNNQPFKTVKDYDDFLKRIHAYSFWTDTAIINMKHGMELGVTHPAKLMLKVLPQLKEIFNKEIKECVFYLPVKKIPETFTAEEKARITKSYEEAIANEVQPAYKRLHDFMLNEYIPKCRTSDGISAIPNGKEYYSFLARFWTTTNLTPDEIYEIGQKEVARIRGEMERVKAEVGYQGDLKSFFKFIHSDKQFMPFKTDSEVINSYRALEVRMQPQLKKLFNLVPKAKFEVRQTEKFREASASAEYNQSAPDGSRPGIFYVPVVNAKMFNSVGMEDLFLHEAIPGHHYQTAIQQENEELPKFRRFGWYGAYGEGWALYTESLGKELGLYKDPYQYFGSLSEEMHRAIRLVVDVGIHMKGMTREQAIQFSLDNEAESEADITVEIERYMAIPGQALAYKIGQMKILEIRKRAEKELGDKFNIQKFHDAVLIDGCLPLDVFENKMNEWMNAQK